MNIERTGTTTLRSRAKLDRLHQAAAGLDHHGSTMIHGNHAVFWLPGVGLQVTIREAVSPRLMMSVATRREISFDTTGTLPAEKQDLSGDKGHSFPLYQDYHQNHSRFSFTTYWNPVTVVGQLVMAAAAALRHQGEHSLSLAEWSERNTMCVLPGTKAGSQFARLERLRAACLAADPESVFSVIGEHDLFYGRELFGLPVVRFSLPNLALDCWLSNDLFRSHLSVNARAIALRLGRAGAYRPRPSAFKGFRDAAAPVYGPYRENRAQFSLRYAGANFLPLCQRVIDAAKVGSKG
ncbi:MAG: hypothetical protein JW873_06990 [Candidatus Saganbacteria bacterium]|nr:hypothetical protein [Candidatus Saganbacteria bacterium]